MNTNIRTKVVNDTNELIFKNKDLLVDNSPDSDTTTVDDNVTVTIVQPKDTKYSIIVYIMEYRRSDEGDIFEADTDEGHKETFKAAKGSVYLVVLLDNTTNSTSTDYYRLNTSSRGKLTSDITIKFKDDSPATNPDVLITIVQTDNQTIHVYTPQKSGGTDHTSTFTCPTGTTYEVEVIADKGYIAGTPNTTEGTFNSDMAINATPAVKAQIYIAKGSKPWYNTYANNNDPQHSCWSDKSKVINVDESVSGQATVICKDVTNMFNMFYQCSSLTSLDLSSFDTSKVTDMFLMFKGCSNLISLDVSKFDTSKVKDMRGMFGDCSKLTSLDVTNFDTSKVTDMFLMFKGCSNLISLDVSKFDTSKVKDMCGMFGDCSKLTTIDVSKFNTSKVTEMDLMFSGCSNVTSLDVSKFDTSKVKDMGRMFNGCNNLTTLDLSSFDTSNVTDMDAMFSQCYKLNTLNVSNFNTSNVTDMNNMFSSCYNLTALDVSNFNTSKVTDMNDMFFHCNNLVSLNLSSFDTSKITNMASMFLNCSNLVSLDVSNFDTSNVTTMWNMFADCSSLASIDLSSFNTSNVKDMRWMFSSCGSLTTIKGVIDMKSCINYNSMFAACTKLKGVKIKNPPTDTDWWKNAGLSESQFTIVS